jgi:alkylation response protein AidB-like acyl-CoA dehydrogenase
VDLSLSATEQELAASARAFVESAVADQVRQLAPDDPGVRASWHRTLARSGWLSLPVPAEHGGAGATALQTAVVFEQFGRGPLPHLPLVSATAAGLLTTAGIPPHWRSELLPAMAEGTVTCVPAGLDQAWAGGGGADLALRLERGAGHGWQLSGVVPAAAFAGSADELLVAVRERDQFRIVRVRQGDPGVSARLLSGFLAWNYEVRLDGVPVPDPGVASVTATDLLQSLRPAMLWTAAYSVGGCARVLEMSRAYCDQRVQFGQPIGRFQRVQDHVIRILNLADQARWGLYEALWRFDEGLPAAASTHLAKAAASEGYWESANAAHEVHAGIGSDPLFGLAAYTRMARTLLHYLGSPRWHKRQMIRAVLHEAGTTRADAATTCIAQTNGTVAAQSAAE